MEVSLEELARAVAAGERPALARALSLAERDPPASAELLARLPRRQDRAHVVGITGPPGAGKSSLAGALLQCFLAAGRRVGILAVDPSSPVSGGALLGDRFRIGEATDETRAFIRSTASRGSLGGLTAAARQMVQLMDVAGFDLIMVETVGTGQSEADVARLADSLLVVFPPGLGDEMQAIKAGILELADLLVVTKSDSSAAQQACHALQAAAPMWRRAPPIHRVSSMSGEGVGELASAVLARAAEMPKSPRRGGLAASPAGETGPDLPGALQRALECRLPTELIGDISPQVLDAPAGLSDLGPQIRVMVRPGVDPFRLGMVAGVLMAVAAEMSLECRILESDPGAGCLRLSFIPRAG